MSRHEAAQARSIFWKILTVQCYQGGISKWIIAMVETRIAPRVRVMKPAKIDYGGDKYPCIVRDISSTGAALDFSELIRIPNEFTLILPDDKLRLPCRVVWRKEYRLGVVFDL
ncbi:PilZ domain-containing protein [Bradyrhizobium icense]|nr:PilZ domain-containing protein [Bradyrhizobium icense]